MIAMRSVVVAAGLAVAVLLLGAPGPLADSACLNDIKAMCGNVQPGGGRIRDCMMEHRTNLSPACKMVIAERMLERAAHRSGPGGAALRPAPGAGEAPK
jgi:hypothetical protein